MLFDRRCTGNSSCPTGEKGNRHAADVATAVATLRRSGARKVAVVGASAWGAVAIGSCVVVDIRGCVALSPALFDLKLGDRLTANIAIARVRAPLLVADAPDDSDSPITRGANPAPPSPTRRRLIRPTTRRRRHGWDTVNDPNDPHRRSAFSARLTTFLDRHLK